MVWALRWSVHGTLNVYYIERNGELESLPTVEQGRVCGRQPVQGDRSCQSQEEHALLVINIQEEKATVGILYTHCNHHQRPEEGSGILVSLTRGRL